MSVDRTKPRFTFDEHTDAANLYMVRDNLRRPPGLPARFQDKSDAEAYCRWKNAIDNGYPDRRVEQRRIQAQDAGAERFYVDASKDEYEVRDRRERLESARFYFRVNADRFCSRLNAAELHDPNGWRVRGEDKTKYRERKPSVESLCPTCDAQGHVAGTTCPSCLVTSPKPPTKPDYDAMTDKEIEWEFQKAGGYWTHVEWSDNYLATLGKVFPSKIKVDAMRVALKAGAR